MYPSFSSESSARFEDEIRTYIVRLRELDSLPSVALRVIELADMEETDRRELVHLIESDQSLAARVLRVSNSAWLGFPGRISSLDRAMAILGFDIVRNLALSVVVSHLFLKEQKDDRLKARDLWYHSLACAVACDQLARRTSFPQPGNAFVAGLLHDLGKILLLRWNQPPCRPVRIWAILPTQLFLVPGSTVLRGNLFRFTISHSLISYVRLKTMNGA